MNIGMNDDDRHGRLEPDQVLAPAPLEDHHEDAVGGADAEQVHERRLERHQRPSGRPRISSRNDSSDDGGDEQRQPIADPVAEVAEGRGLPADVRGGRAVRERRREARRSRSRSTVVAASPRPAARVVGNGDERRHVAIRRSARAGATEAMPGSAATAPRPAARRRPRSAEMSTAMTSGPLTPGPKPSATRS